uniref:Uncharacterized protein n=1 Tax=uncultured marine virus TaxID=186617 RepID=A0A0F7LAA7_9VIRU|nr:hypothetical protein [uncultured marine virus]
MTTNYPTGLDDFTNVTPGTTDGSSSKVGEAVGGRTLSGFINDHNDATEALQVKVGIDGSAVTTTHDYKLSSVTSSAKAVSTAGDQTVAGTKTFSGDVLVTSPQITTGINDSNDVEVIGLTAAASAVNNFQISNSAAAGDLPLTAEGTDTNINISLLPKGTGVINVTGTTNYEDNVSGDDDIPNKKWVVDNTAAFPSLTTLLVGSTDSTATSDSRSVGVNTVAYARHFNIPADMVVNKISLEVTATSVAGTYDIAIFSEDGQTQVISVTSASVSGTGILTTAVSAVSLSAGNYWFVFLPNSTASNSFRFLNSSSGTVLMTGVVGEPDLAGTLAVTASTMPATITPTDIDGSSIDSTVFFRLDN